MWAVVSLDGVVGVVTVEGESRKEIEREIKERFEVKLIMTKEMVERLKGLSIYEFAKKYGEKGWNFDVWEYLKGVNTNG